MNSLRAAFVLAVATCLSGSEGQAGDKKANKLPDKAKSILDKAERFELFSLDPEAGEEKGKAADRFRGWKVLGKTTVEGDVRKHLLAALYRGIADSDGIGARCFEPRHGIRATAGGSTVDLVICFECDWIYTYYDKDQKQQAGTATVGVPQLAFDAVLKKAGVPLPKHAKK